MPKKVKLYEQDEIRAEKLNKLGKDSYQYQFATRLKELINKSGLTQQAISDKIRTEYAFSSSGSLISNYLNGEVPQTFEKIVNLAAALNVTCDELLAGNRPEYVALSKELGLSQAAIDNILLIKNNYSHLMPLLNNILSSVTDPENPLFLILQFLNTPATDSMLLYTDSGDVKLLKDNAELMERTSAKKISRIALDDLTETYELTKISNSLTSMKNRNRKNKSNNNFNVYAEDCLTKKGVIDCTTDDEQK